MTEAAKKAGEIAELTRQAALTLGAHSVIVMVGLPDGADHNAYAVRWFGKCLEVRGLLETSVDDVRGGIVYKLNQ